MDLLEFEISNEEGKYYRSNRDYISVDCRWVDDEIYGTPMSERDLLYLLNEPDFYIGDMGLIHFSYNGFYIGSIRYVDFVRPSYYDDPNYHHRDYPNPD